MIKSLTTILIVGDSRIERNRIAALLTEKFQGRVLFATNGGEALTALEKRSSDVDLMLSDLQMPVMDGIELMMKVRGRYPSLPVIVMTSQGSEEIAMRALQCGASGYVPKRRLKQDLIGTVQRVLNANRKSRAHAKIFQSMTDRRFTIELDNERKKLPAVIGYLQDAAAQFGLYDECNRARLGIALEEALLNGLIHGNLEVSSELRHADDEAFNRLIRERQNTEPYHSRKLRITCDISRERVVFRIRDEGPGFDVSSIPDPTDADNLLKPSGRGLLMMKNFMDLVEYNKTGNEVTMALFVRTPKPEPGNSHSRNEASALMA